MKFATAAWGLLLGCAALCAQTPEAFHRELLVGSWKASSWKAQGASQPTSYRQYQECGDGFMMHTLVSVDPAQRHAHLLVAAVKYDGKEYPTYAEKGLAAILSTGTPPAQTVSFKVLAAYTLEWTDRTGGKPTVGGRVTISQDGRTMTITANRYGADGKQTPLDTQLYEKQ